MLQHLNPILLPVNIVIIEQVAQNKVQGGDKGKDKSLFRKEEDSLLFRTSEG